MYDPQPPFRVEKAEQIGGWLIFLAIGITLTPLNLINDIFISADFFDSKTWAVHWKSQSWGLLIITFFELVYNMFYLVFSVVIIILFYKRRSSLPRVLSIYLCVILFVTIMDTVLVNWLSGTDFSKSSYQNIYRSIAMVLIWIPYFRISQRAGMTFVKRLHHPNGGNTAQRHIV
jgi:hypothetical protein